MNNVQWAQGSDNELVDNFNQVYLCQFKFDMINAFNQPYLPGPVVNPTQTTFGQISASNQNNYARRLQYGIKFLF